MERFLVFSGQDYYPSCGWTDFRESFCSKEKAIEYIKMRIAEKYGRDDWYQIIDTLIPLIIFECDEDGKQY